MNKEIVTINFEWLWGMMPLEVANEWIEEIKKGIDCSSSMYGKEIFPSAIHEEKNLILLDNDTDETSVIMKFTKNSKGDLIFEVVETIVSHKELAERLSKL